MPKSQPTRTTKTVWLIAGVLACYLGWQQYRGWQRYKRSQQLWSAVQGCQVSYTSPEAATSCDVVKIHDLLAQGANIHYAQESYEPSIFLQTDYFRPSMSFLAVGTPQQKRAFAERQQQTIDRIMPARNAAANLLLDAWVADNARKAWIGAHQRENEAYHAGLLALQLNRPELVAPMLDTMGKMYEGRILVEALLHSQFELVKVLLARGASLESPDGGSASALSWACLTEDKPTKLEIVKYLLEHGADVNHIGSGGSSILRSAASYGSGTVALLLAHGAKVNVQDKDGYTALIMAASNGDEASVKMLLAHGADPDLRTQKGETALSRAIQYKHTGVARLLQQAGTKQ